jgi:magnesium transporter
MSRRREKKRLKPVFRRSGTPGAAPGTLTPPANAQPTTMRYMAYGPERFEEGAAADIAAVQQAAAQYPVVWLDVAGLADIATVERIGRAFRLHPLALEDTVHPHQRAKVDEYDSHDFVVVRMPPMAGEEDTEQIALFVGTNFVISFQERPGDCLDPLRERIRQHKGRVRSEGPDYLAYSILDAVVDSYFAPLEACGEELEALEDDTIASPTRGIVHRIYAERRRLLAFRRAVWPLRDALSAILREPPPRFSPSTRVFLRDTYDHTVQIVDLLELYRELAAGLMEVYLSSVSNRMNEIMKVLTIISTVFIPLTFIAGVYGMNFNTDASPLNMPELNWRFGYVLVMGSMAVLALAMLAMFRRWGWLGKEEREKMKDEG